MVNDPRPPSVQRDVTSHVSRHAVKASVLKKGDGGDGEWPIGGIGAGGEPEFEKDKSPIESITRGGQSDFSVPNPQRARSVLVSSRKKVDPSPPSSHLPLFAVAHESSSIASPFS
jgi:hypothetical protein